MSELVDHTAIVTGAGSGIGRAIAKSLALAGARIFAVGRTLATIEETVDLIVAAGGQAIAVVADVTQPAQILELRRRVHESTGTLHILVNNAGAVLRAPLQEISDDQWRLMVAANLDSAFYTCRAFADDLIATRGRIINIASIAGRQGTAMLSAYCAAKHGLVGLTRALAEELRCHGVCINAICPGSVATAMLKRGLPDATPDMQPADIANTVLFLASRAPRALTGSCIDVYG